VGRVAQRPSSGGRVQPGLRFRAAQRRVAILGRPRARLQAAATAPLAIGLCACPMWLPTNRHSNHRRGNQRRATRIYGRTPGPRTWNVLFTRHHDAPDLVGLPRRHRIRLAISNALWPMVLPTPYAMTTSLELGSDGSRLMLPVVPVQGAAAPAFQAPQPSEERKDITSVGYPWPGEWTLERDEANQKATVHWKGKAKPTIPGARKPTMKVWFTTSTTPIPRPARSMAKRRASSC